MDLKVNDQIESKITGTAANKQSHPYVNELIITPAVAPPMAPAKFIVRSLAPCAEVLRVASTDELNSAEPEIKVNDQPKPNKNNPIPSRVMSSAFALPATIVEVSKISKPT